MSPYREAAPPTLGRVIGQLGPPLHERVGMWTRVGALALATLVVAGGATLLAKEPVGGGLGVSLVEGYWKKTAERRRVVLLYERGFAIEGCEPIHFDEVVAIEVSKAGFGVHLCAQRSLLLPHVLDRGGRLRALLRKVADRNGLSAADS
ncbi:MAG: hypothetical protein IT370_36585 [Deltaproteobacteria bacterium]|nr:hypothetical protein [Deltaproteobacteria bacterium]